MNVSRLAGSALIGFCLLAGHVDAQQSVSSAVRQTWEYKTVTVEQGISTSQYQQNDTRFLEDGQRFSSPPNAREKANQLGLQGWELVSVVATENSTYRIHTLWFKRPRSQ